LGRISTADEAGRDATCRCGGVQAEQPRTVVRDPQDPVEGLQVAGDGGVPDAAMYGVDAVGLEGDGCHVSAARSAADVGPRHADICEFQGDVGDGVVVRPALNVMSATLGPRVC
jgi:hypothetical protein